MDNKLKGLKNKIKVTGKKVLDTLERKRKMLVCFALYSSLQMNEVICYAEEVKEKTVKDAESTIDVIKQLNSLKNLITAIISAVGAVVLVKNIFEFASAYQGADSSGMNTALKGIIGGGMMLGVGGILTFLGVTS